jgi:Zn-dependent protease with chaperone function
MIVSVYVPLILPALVVPVIRRACWRLSPALASWLLALACLVLAVCSTAALSLLLFAALSVTGVFAHIGHWSPAVLRQLDAVHLPIDIVAGLLLVVLGANMLRLGNSKIRALRATHRMASSTLSGSELVVVEGERPLAHALPGRPGRIVVSTSMLAVLGPAERRALLAHERAHLAHAHHLFVSLVDILAAVNPLLRPLTSAIRYTTERWADEVAADEVGDRAVVAQAVAKAALASKVSSPSNGIAMAMTTGPVPRRVKALLIAAPASRLRAVLTSPTGLLAVLGCCLLLGSVFSSMDAVADLHRVVELAQYSGHALSRRH